MGSTAPMGQRNAGTLPSWGNSIKSCYSQKRKWKRDGKILRGLKAAIVMKSVARVLGTILRRVTPDEPTCRGNREALRLPGKAGWTLPALHPREVED
jgi:hypothetical protein